MRQSLRELDSFCLPGFSADYCSSAYPGTFRPTNEDRFVISITLQQFEPDVRDFLSVALALKTVSTQSYCVSCSRLGLNRGADSNTFTGSTAGRSGVDSPFNNITKFHEDP